MRNPLQTVSLLETIGEQRFGPGLREASCDPLHEVPDSLAALGFRDDGWESVHTQVLRDDGVVRPHVAGGAGEGHAARVEDDDVVGEVEGELDVLLDQHD